MEKDTVDRSSETGVINLLPFEARQFIAACRVASVYCLVVQIINVVGGVHPSLTVLLFALMILLEWMRHKVQRHELSAGLQWGFAVSTLVSLTLAWMLNGGVHGSVPMVYLLALFLALSISETRRLQMFSVYLGSAMVCLALQAAQPEWITFYSSDRVQDVDRALGLLTAMFALGYGTHQFKSSYDRQRLRLQAKNEELSQANLDGQETNDRLQQVMRRNHEHLHIITHDLRNPVGAVIGLVEVCREEYELSEAMARDLDTMEQAATQALDLIQQLSTVTYLEERKVTLQKAPTQLAPIVEQVLRKLEPVARKKQQKLDWQLDAEIWSLVDSYRLSSILDNLVGNAIKYSPLGSALEVVLEGGQQVVVRVRDQGPGIAEDQRGKLFTMFGKVGTRPTGKETSTGLGLYIARMLSELHGGRLEQENLNPGSEFRLLLPIYRSSH